MAILCRFASLSDENQGAIVTKRNCENNVHNLLMSRRKEIE